ncbi:hypothetical protein BDN70DRAFT_359239 [Pholiota conissans]|uniref:RBR-type E3 ubiquitin transferase n=1 Tax=Pholiota conissans TaxID=109636 RepID=A0A9P6CWL2_9AGAR|nr:hypothetical protein BDN70DRAFT_359239 [Pholiota conissans]
MSNSRPPRGGSKASAPENTKPPSHQRDKNAARNRPPVVAQGISSDSQLSRSSTSNAYNVSNFPVKATICRNWVNGNCANGAQCRFKHGMQTKIDVGEVVGPNSRSPTVSISTNTTAGQKKEERARRKNEDRQEINQKRREEEARIRDEGRRARENAEKETAMRARREKEAAAIEQYIVSESSLVTCAAGLNIQSVVCGFDLCGIAIKNLPNDVQRDEIADIFIQQGVASSEFFILNLKSNGAKREAVVVANVDQGQNIAIGLEGIEFRNENLTFEVSENASWNGMSAATQDTPFLMISWWAPSETILVSYHSEQQAREQVQKLDGKTWNGRRIRAMLSNRPHNAGYFTSLHGITILGCTPGTSLRAEFYAFVDSYNVRMLSAAKHNLDDVFYQVREHLRNYPGVQMDTYKVLNNGTGLDGEARIKVGFNDWDKAKRAHDVVDKKRLIGGNFPLLRSWLPTPLQYSIKISLQQFQVQKSQWDELSEKKPGCDAHVQTRVGDLGDIVFIRVLGQDKKAAGSLKVRVEGMVAGEKLDATYWHPSFGFPRGKAFLNRVFSEKQVFVRPDFRMRCLRVCGEPIRVEEAKQMIKGEVDRLSGMETTWVLDPACKRGFMREGLGKLKELLGDDNVTVNIASAPYKVTVKGGAEATHHLQRLMDEARVRGISNEAHPGDRETCPICTDDVLNGEKLACGHTYCSGCLSHFLISAVDNKNFPLACMGNGGACHVPFPIPSIRRFLPPQLFEELVEAAFATYLEQHAQELKYCTTPDCKQIYRKRYDRTLLKCPACFSTICPICDEESHEGMTCEERKGHLDDQLDGDVARRFNIRKCPRCSAPIQKDGGCNHMTCRQCQAHICWMCMGLFTKDEIYIHMGTPHVAYDATPAPAPAPAPTQNHVNPVDDEAAAMVAQIWELEQLEHRKFERIRREREALFRLQPPIVNSLPAATIVPVVDIGVGIDPYAYVRPPTASGPSYVAHDGQMHQQPVAVDSEEELRTRREVEEAARLRERQEILERQSREFQAAAVWKSAQTRVEGRAQQEAQYVLQMPVKLRKSRRASEEQATPEREAPAKLKKAPSRPKDKGGFKNFLKKLLAPFVYSSKSNSTKL